MEQDKENKENKQDWLIADSKNSKEFLDSSKILKDAIFADLHIHSKYSRATSINLSFENLVKWAKIKGLNLLGTGDFTHPVWFEEIKQLEDRENGFYYYAGFPFIITGEISLIYTQERGRRIHLVILVPNIEIAEKINAYLDTKGRRDYDGRPIFKIPGDEFVREMMKISKDIEIIPAHCLLGNEIIHTIQGIKKIKDVKKGDLVYTHKNQWKKVKEVLKRDYKGEMIKIIPWYFKEGLATTPEHPFYAIKSYKNCSWTKGLCKIGCSEEINCKKKHFLNYKKEWIKAENLEKNDFLVYPRFKEEKNLEEIKLTEFIKEFQIIDEEFIIPKNSRNNKCKIRNVVKIDTDFCRLVGYYLSEGYCIRNEAIAFSFNSKEKEYIEDVISLIKKIFGVNSFKIDSRKNNQADIIFYSHILNDFFRIFYLDNMNKSWTKSIPFWIVQLSKEKIAEILRGWWRGDAGVTVSRKLANDIKLICLKLGIIPSISIETSEKFNQRRHFIENREIISKNDLIIFSNLSFFGEDYKMLTEKCFKKSINKIKRKHGWIDENYIYIPIRKIEIEKYQEEVYNLEVEDDNSYVAEFACVHNCMTPWFGLFGSMSGFDSLKECFKEQFKNVHAVESGMSADPKMLWKIKELETKSIVSFSDSHSFWPFRLGREATIFKKTGSYHELIRQIRENDFIATIETDPSYGKYHYDGHRLCNFSCSPKKSKELNGICPICKKQLTIGVDNRVVQLTDTVENYKPKNMKPFYTLLPLHEVIALSINSKIENKKTWEIYNGLIGKFENEFNILLNLSKEEMISKKVSEKLIDLILRNREGKIKIEAGYDGVYGIAQLEEKQKRLF